MMLVSRAGRYILVVLIAVGVGFGFGVFVAREPRVVTKTILPDWLANTVPGAATDADTFRRVWESIKTTYVEQDVSDQQLIEGAIKGLVGALKDPYTVFLTKDESKEFQDEIKGSFEGVGMEVGQKNERLTVIAPLPDSPAEKAGVRAGDAIIAIDGVNAQTLTLDEAVKKIRGPRESTVTLVIQRGKDDPATLKIVRQTIQVASVASRLETRGDQKVAVIRVTSFTKDTEQRFRQAALDALNQNVAGLIIDLRNNPGGYLDQSVGVASAIIPSGTIVSEVDRQGKKRNLDARGGAILAGQKLVVLVNGGSASASEIVAGALQDTKAATVIGQKTYGKGTVQELDELPDGSSLKLTVAKWLTPNGTSISEQGITPETVVELTEEDYAADRDPQLDAAMAKILAA